MNIKVKIKMKRIGGRLFVRYADLINNAGISFNSDSLYKKEFIYIHEKYAMKPTKWISIYSLSKSIKKTEHNAFKKSVRKLVLYDIKKRLRKIFKKYR